MYLALSVFTHKTTYLVIVYTEFSPYCFIMPNQFHISQPLSSDWSKSCLLKVSKGSRICNQKWMPM